MNRRPALVVVSLLVSMRLFADTFTLELVPGWNLVSVPIAPNDQTPANVFGDPRLGPAWEWRSTPKGYGKSAAIVTLCGYWVFCARAARGNDDAVSVEVAGTPPSDQAHPIGVGWNLVGTVDGDVTRLQEAFGPVFTWDVRGQYYRIAASSGSSVDSLEALTRGSLLRRQAGDPQNAFWVFNSGVYLIIDVSAGPSASTYPVSYRSVSPAGGWTDEYKTTRIVLRRVPAGTFTMGSPTNELGREGWDTGNETQRSVTLTKDFYVGVFEVTQKQWERVMGTWPSYFSNTTYRDARPVEQVSWNAIRGGSWPGSPAGSGQPAAGTFIQKLRDRTGLSFDLPTEAQWEYACRARTTTALNSGKNLTSVEQCPNMAEVGRYWYNGGSSYPSGGNTSVGSAKAGSYLPNAWGLYDMHGNVWEWCLDWYVTAPAGGADPLGPGSGARRAERGGSWGSDARHCRSAARYGNRPDNGDYILGFRLVRAVP